MLMLPSWRVSFPEEGVTLSFLLQGAFIQESSFTKCSNINVVAVKFCCYECSSPLWSISVDLSVQECSNVP